MDGLIQEWVEVWQAVKLEGRRLNRSLPYALPYAFHAVPGGHIVMRSIDSIDSSLNAPNTVVEVASAVGKLRRGKASGPDGVRGEFLRDALVKVHPAEEVGGQLCTPGGPCSHCLTVCRNVVLPVLHVIINAAFTTGQYPASWFGAAVPAVF